MNKPKRSYMDKVVDVEWSDAWDDADIHPSDLPDHYYWHTYGKVIRENDDVLTVATQDGGRGEKDHQVHATSIPWPMIMRVEVLK